VSTRRLRVRLDPWSSKEYGNTETSLLAGKHCLASLFLNLSGMEGTRPGWWPETIVIGRRSLLYTPTGLCACCLQ
jgi:hypothetical protein